VDDRCKQRMVLRVTADFVRLQVSLQCAAALLRLFGSACPSVWPAVNSALDALPAHARLWPAGDICTSPSAPSAPCQALLSSRAPPAPRRWPTRLLPNSPVPLFPCPTLLLSLSCLPACLPTLLQVKSAINSQHNHEELLEMLRGVFGESMSQRHCGNMPRVWLVSARGVHGTQKLSGAAPMFVPACRGAAGAAVADAGGVLAPQDPAGGGAGPRWV
jgi:hypothetical protein